MFAISTSWNSWKYYQAKDIIEEIKSLGFEQIELNFSLSANLVEEMVALKEQGLIKVVSIHNFCPIPVGIPRKYASPDVPSLSALNERERQSAVHYTEKTIDTAARIGAEAVIMHTGRVRMRERIKDLDLLQKRGNRKRFERLREKTLKERKVKSKRFFSLAR